MTDKFKVGQRVRIIKGSHKGAEALILEQRQKCHRAETFEIIFAYILDVEGLGSRHPDGVWVGAPEDWLAPIYDGYEKTTWEGCYKVTGWKPKEVVKLD